MLLNLILNWPVFSSFPVSQYQFSSDLTEPFHAPPWTDKSGSQTSWAFWLCLGVGFFFLPCYLKLRSNLRHSQNADSVTACGQRELVSPRSSKSPANMFLFGILIVGSSQRNRPMQYSFPQNSEQQDKSRDSYTWKNRSWLNPRNSSELGTGKQNDRAKKWIKEINQSNQLGTPEKAFFPWQIHLSNWSVTERRAEPCVRQVSFLWLLIIPGFCRRC